MFNIPIFLDTKFTLGLWSKNIDFVKINKKEFLESDNKNPFSVRFCKNLIVTTGENGAVLNQTEDFPLEKKVEVSNVCGAGDTFLAALVINFLETKDIKTAIKWANKACSYKVTQKGVIAVPREKVN
jgi:sugar/nucleoside kinase (ribokinase family)